MTTLRTARLILRPFVAEDAAPFAALNADREVMANFPKTLTRAESDHLIAVFEARRKETGIGFAAVSTLDGAFLGMCGLSRPAFSAPFVPCVEIGWRLTRAAWGKGYASEAARVWLAHGFGELCLKEIVAFTVATNHRSEAVMRRIGMTRDMGGDFLHPGLATDHRLAPHILYRIRACGHSSPARSARWILHRTRHPARGSVITLSGG